MSSREGFVFQLRDTSEHRLDGSFLLGGRTARNPEPLIARLAHQLLRQNRGVLDLYEIDARVDFDGSAVWLRFQTGSTVGALPLLSPTSGRSDYGLVVRPRFGWEGIGPALNQTGWRVVPSILRLPTLPRSDRKVPPWVLSSVVISRVDSLLERIRRKFEMYEETLRAPRGQVDWGAYATRSMSTARMLDVPCRYPDLREDAELLGAIHYTLRRHHNALQGQREAGPVVTQLIGWCLDLLARVRSYAPQRPSSTQLRDWSRSNSLRTAMRDGIDAIEWTVDERGLAGLGELAGLPWIMRMEEFFEAWIEAIADDYVKRRGGRIRVGRNRETVSWLNWRPRTVGTQRYLLPDVIIEEAERDVIIDAKYKRHWEELNIRGWKNASDYIRETHREDLLQVLAYANISDKKHVTCVIAYPCLMKTWNSLRERGLLSHRAQVTRGQRRVELILTAFPLGLAINEAARAFDEVVASASSF